MTEIVFRPIAEAPAGTVAGPTNDWSRAHLEQPVTRMGAVAMAVAVATVSSWLVGAGGWAPPAGSAYAMIAPDPTPASTATPTPTATATATAAPTTAAPRTSCATVRRPFTLRTISIPGITRRAGIVTPPRVGLVPGAPPLTTAGKELFAWDKQSGVRPGDRSGNVRLNAHVWPDGSAVGNRMLAGLHRGDRIVVYGTHLRLCYRVTERVQVLPSRGLFRYYRTDGRPQLAIVVCSGRRLGPGEWEKRTVWFARPKA